MLVKGPLLYQFDQSHKLWLTTVSFFGGGYKLWLTTVNFLGGSLSGNTDSVLFFLFFFPTCSLCRFFSSICFYMCFITWSLKETLVYWSNRLHIQKAATVCDPDSVLVVWNSFNPCFYCLALLLCQNFLRSHKKCAFEQWDRKAKEWQDNFPSSTWPV